MTSQLTAAMVIPMAIGAMLGAICRYEFEKWCSQALEIKSPWAILAVNILGSLILGCAAGSVAGGLLSHLLGSNLTLIFSFIQGFTGAFTPFSTACVHAVSFAYNSSVFPVQTKKTRRSYGSHWRVVLKGSYVHDFLQSASGLQRAVLFAILTAILCWIAAGVGYVLGNIF